MNTNLKDMDTSPLDFELSELLNDKVTSTSPNVIGKVLERTIQYWNDSNEKVDLSSLVTAVLDIYNKSDFASVLTTPGLFVLPAQKSRVQIYLTNHLSVVLYKGKVEDIPFEPYTTFSSNPLTLDLTNLIPHGNDGLVGPFNYNGHSAFIVFNNAMELVKPKVIKGIDYEYFLQVGSLTLRLERDGDLSLLTTTSKNLALAALRRIYTTVNPVPVGFTPGVTADALLTNQLYAAMLPPSTDIRAGGSKQYRVAIPRDYARNIIDGLSITDESVSLEFFSEDIKLRNV